MTENDKDIELLRSDPNSLIVKYQETIKIIVKMYIVRGIFKMSDLDDIIQEVNAALLTKIPAMQSQYNGMSLFKTYFSVIVRNICLKEFARIKREISVGQFDFAGNIVSPHVDEKIVFEGEVRRFRTILNLYYNQRPKLLLCLKLYYRIPLTQEDIYLWYPNCNTADQSVLLENFGSSFDGKNDAEIYKTITPIMNKNENKSNSDDAVRKWTDSKIHEIVDVLNGSPKRLNYTQETLRTLVDDFFSPFLLEK
ncbi:MAG: sigma-70 family RNA polymerase sigma factor [Bacteroidota bacterium]